MDLASAASATLVTTEKDWVRMDASRASDGRLKSMSRVLPIAMTFGERDAERLKALLEVAVRAEVWARRPNPVQLVAHLAIALQRGVGCRIGLLQLDAPVAQIRQRDRLAGHGAGDEIAGRYHLELTIEKLHAGLAFETEQPFEPVHFATVTIKLGQKTAPPYIVRGA